MLFFANSVMLLTLDSFLLLLCFSVFVCVWMVFMFFLFMSQTVKMNNNFVFLDFISSKYLDLYWFLLGSFFISALLLSLSLLLYYSWLSLLVFDLCSVVAFQWYWIFFLFKDSVIFSNLLVESDYFMGDLRLLQCNNNFTLLSLVVYKLWLTSIDVMHSFTISSLGVKVDCMPGSCTELAIVSNMQGTFYGQCSELCGVLHGFMPIVITFI